jgi:hypothetical protein
VQLLNDLEWQRPSASIANVIGGERPGSDPVRPQSQVERVLAWTEPERNQRPGEPVRRPEGGEPLSDSCRPKERSRPSARMSRSGLSESQPQQKEPHRAIAAVAGSALLLGRAPFSFRATSQTAAGQATATKAGSAGQYPLALTPMVCTGRKPDSPPWTALWQPSRRSPGGLPTADVDPKRTRRSAPNSCTGVGR